MAKIRGIKPDFWTDEDMVELSIPARLLFIGLWTYACDNGHLQDKPKQIKMRILPADDVNCSQLLTELANAGRIERADGWITVPNLAEHQKIDPRYFTSCDKGGCDDPPEKVSHRESRRAHAVQPAGARRAPSGRTAVARADGEGIRSDSDGDGDKRGAAKATKSPIKRSKAVQLPSNWNPSDTHAQFAIENRLDLLRESDQFRDHHLARASTFVDWDRAFWTWIRNAVKYAKPTQAASSSHDPDAWMRMRG